MRPYSMDLRERAMARLEGGETVRVVAEALSVAPSTVVKWSLRRRATGSAAPGKIGGHVPGRIQDGHAQWLRQRMKSDFTVRGLAAELADRGLKLHHGTVWKFVRREGLSFKKNSAAQRADPA